MANSNLRNYTHLQGCLDHISGDASNISGTVSELLNGDVSGLKGDVTNVVGFATGISGDINHVVFIGRLFRIVSTPESVKEGTLSILLKYTTQALVSLNNISSWSLTFLNDHLLSQKLAMNNTNIQPTHEMQMNQQDPITSEPTTPKIKPPKRRSGLYGPLHYAVIIQDTSLINSLLDEGHDVNETGSRGYTSLHLAVKLGDIEIINLLLNRGANPLAEDKKGKTPFDIAETGQIREMLKEAIIWRPATKYLSGNYERTAKIGNAVPVYLQTKRFSLN
ncbi:ankyrin repeat domain-containing protein [Candidatus Micrarchaeota archaeon]|nr:ankyrin repeat domain-containing protein [Candidatus Micrarchaeota archaeon]